MARIYIPKTTSFSTNGITLTTFEGGKVYDLSPFATDIALSSNVGVPESEYVAQQAKNAPKQKPEETKEAAKDNPKPEGAASASAKKETEPSAKS